MEREYPHRGPAWTEWALCGVVLLLVAQGLAMARLHAPPSYTAQAAAVLAALVLPLRWRRPLPVLGVAGVALVAQGAYEPMTVMVFHLAAQGRMRAAVAAGAVAGALPWLCGTPLSGGVTPTYGAGLLFTLALTAGLWWHSRRRLIDSLSEQVELRVQQARAAERARIAAEMHDVLAHRLSLLALHTGVLALRTDTLPPQVGERIALLRATSTQALADLRDVLGVLRAQEGAGDGPGGGAVCAPAIRDLSDLLDEVRAGGQEVTADVTGDPDTAPATHLLAVHRLVQEGLTNARKHAPGAAVRLTVHYGAPATEVELVNAAGDAFAPRPDGAAGRGFGLVGLAERVAGLHGRLDHGPGPDGGWRLIARLPVRGTGTERDGAGNTGGPAPRRAAPFRSEAGR
ncbi:sensor histidine kinase [Streptomyces sp. NPDC001750]|uniref:sensor histidine kinase n=1 Tax=unclassified Streptomyces TaxID=2593676 RepID=UPI0036788C82